MKHLNQEGTKLSSGTGESTELFMVNERRRLAIEYEEATRSTRDFLVAMHLGGFVALMIVGSVQQFTKNPALIGWSVWLSSVAGCIIYSGRQKGKFYRGLNLRAYHNWLDRESAKGRE